MCTGTIRWVFTQHCQGAAMPPSTSKSTLRETVTLSLLLPPVSPVPGSAAIAVSKSHPICMYCKQDVVDFLRLAQYFDTLTHDCRTPNLQHRIPVHFQHWAIHKKSQEPLWSAMEFQHNRSRHVGSWGRWRGVKCNDMLCNAVNSCWGRWSMWVCGTQTAKAEWLQRSGLTKLCLLRPQVDAQNADTQG